MNTLTLLITCLSLWFTAPTPTTHKVNITTVIKKGAASVATSGKRTTLTAPKASALKVILNQTTVLTLGEESTLVIDSAGHLKIEKGHITAYITGNKSLTLRHRSLLFQLKPGVHHVAVEPEVSGVLFEKMPTQVPPAPQPGTPERKSPSLQSPPKEFAIAGNLCVLRGELLHTLPQKPLCRKKGGACFTAVSAGSCLLSDEPEEEPEPVLFLPSMTTQTTPLDFIALIPSLNKKLGDKKKGGQNSESVAGTSGGSMCLDSSGGQGGAGDVGQSNQEPVKPTPLSRVTFRISFPR